MVPLAEAAGHFTPRGTSLRLNRMGFGAMQLTGPMAFGEPRDRAEAVAVVREAVALGVNHIDTSDYYGPYIGNEILREALAPYPADLTLVTKVGARRGADKSWPTALSKNELIEAVHGNLKRLDLDQLDIVNLRVGGQLGPNEASIAAPLEALAAMQAQGLIRHIGLSNISPRQYEEGRRIVPIVCVQNHFNLAHRRDDAFIDALAQDGVAYTPFFPLGGFRPIASPALDAVAHDLAATVRQVALAWLLQRSPNMLVIAGTSSRAHLRENLAAADLRLPDTAIQALNAIAAPQSA